MGSYVLLERQNLEEMLGKLSQEEDIADSSNSGAGNVLTYIHTLIPPHVIIYP